MNVGKIFTSLVVIFVVVGGLAVFQATRTSASNIVTPTDLATDGAARSRIRVAGRVTPEGLDYQVKPKIVLKFTIEEPGKGGVRIPVVYEGLKPDMFAPGRDVLIDGDFTNNTLHAAHLLTQCPSKYEPPSPGDLAHPPRGDDPASKGIVPSPPGEQR
jgi:cytochrome c-type biogenesis protein CcmE